MSGSDPMFEAYDGNGNVAELVGATTGQIAQAFDYRPFGESLREAGRAGSPYVFRFSTKYQDGETDLLYYAQTNRGAYVAGNVEPSDFVAPPLRITAEMPSRRAS